MSAGNRLTKEELRSEVKEYLISLREERIQRSIEVKERLRQLRLARIERLHDVRTSLAVMESIRVKAQLEDNREDLRERVQQLRAEARSMLQRYSETRKIGFANAENEADETLEERAVIERELESVVDGSVRELREEASASQSNFFREFDCGKASGFWQCSGWKFAGEG